MTVVFTSDGAWQREGFVATVQLVDASTPSPTHVGDTWAPTTPTPTGPRSCTRECCAPHAPRMELRPTGVDAIEMSTSDGGTWSWSCSKDCPSTRAECSVAVPINRWRNFTEVIGPLPSGLATLSCKGRITEMYRTCVALASQSPPSLTCISVEKPKRLVRRSMPINAINGSLEVLAMLPQLEFMYAPTTSAPARPNRSASAMVCSDLKDNLIDGTLEPLASLSRLRLLCDPSMASPCDVPLLLERPSLGRYTV